MISHMIVSDKWVIVDDHHHWNKMHLPLRTEKIYYRRSNLWWEWCVSLTYSNVRIHYTIPTSSISLFTLHFQRNSAEMGFLIFLCDDWWNWTLRNVRKVTCITLIENLLYADAKKNRNSVQRRPRPLTHEKFPVANYFIGRVSNTVMKFQHAKQVMNKIWVITLFCCYFPE